MNSLYTTTGILLANLIKKQYRSRLLFPTIFTNFPLLKHSLLYSIVSNNSFNLLSIIPPTSIVPKNKSNLNIFKLLLSIFSQDQPKLQIAFMLYSYLIKKSNGNILL